MQSASFLCLNGFTGLSYNFKTFSLKRGCLEICQIFFFFYPSPPYIGNRSCMETQQQQKQKGEWLSGSFKPENFIPGLVIGFIFGLLLDLSKPSRNQLPKKIFSSSKLQQKLSVSSNGDQELKMVSPLVYSSFHDQFLIL